MSGAADRAAFLRSFQLVVHVQEVGMNIAFGRANRARLPRRARVVAQMVAFAAAIPLLIASAMLAGAQTATPPASAAACPAGTPGAATKTPSASASPEARQCVTIDMEDIYFKPNVVTIPANKIGRAHV